MRFEEENYRNTIFSKYYQGYTVATRCITVDTDLLGQPGECVVEACERQDDCCTRGGLTFLSENEISSLACCLASFSLLKNPCFESLNLPQQLPSSLNF